MSDTGYPITPSTDSFTGAMVAITGDHAYTHKGRRFIMPVQISALTAGSSTSIVLTTPAAAVAYVHFRPESVGSTASFVRVRIFEGSTYTGGAAATPINANRNSSRTAATTVLTEATQSVSGTLIDVIDVGSGGTPTSRSGGSVGQDNELILLPETDYIIQVLNPAGGSTTDVDILLSWYEEAEGV